MQVWMHNQILLLLGFFLVDFSTVIINLVQNRPPNYILDILKSKEGISISLIIS